MLFLKNGKYIKFHIEDMLSQFVSLHVSWTVCINFTLMDIHDGLRFQCDGLEVVMVQIITTQLNCHKSAMHGKDMVAVVSGKKQHAKNVIIRRNTQIRHKISDNKE